MTDADVANAREQAAPPSRNAKERTLVFIVVFLGLLIIAGLAAVVLRIIYLSANPPQQDGTTAGAAPAVGTATVPLSLPSGAVVKAISLSGDRVAVHYDAPAGAGIAVLDVASGRVLNRIDLTEDAPR